MNCCPSKMNPIDRLIAKWRAEFAARAVPPITAHRAEAGLFYDDGEGDDTLVTSETGSATIWIYDVIGQDLFGGISAKAFARVWDSVKDAAKITLRINSPGGDVFEGTAIASLISERKSKVKVIVDGLAASIASLIAVTADERVMHRNAMWMVHDPWGIVSGTAEDMRSVADALDKIGEQMVRTYAEATGQPQKYWREAMHDETWFDSRQALENGLVSGLVEEQPQNKAAVELAAKINAMKKVLARA